MQGSLNCRQKRCATSVSGAFSVLVLPAVPGELVLEFVLLDEEQHVSYEKYSGE